MNDNNLPAIKKEGIFKRIQNWFKEVFGKITIENEILEQPTLDKPESGNLKEKIQPKETQNSFKEALKLTEDRSNDNELKEVFDKSNDVNMVLEQPTLGKPESNLEEKIQPQKIQNSFKESLKVVDNQSNDLKELLDLNGIVTSKDPTEYDLEETMAASRKLKDLVKNMEASSPETLIEGVKRKMSLLDEISTEFIQENPKMIETILNNVRKNGLSVRHIKGPIKDLYPEIMMEAVKQNGEAILYTSDEFKNNHYDIVLDAVIQKKDIASELPEQYNSPDFLEEVDRIKNEREERKKDSCER